MRTSYRRPRRTGPDRALARRRLASAVVAVLALAGVAAGSAAGAVASAHDDQAEHALARVHGI